MTAKEGTMAEMKPYDAKHPKAAALVRAGLMAPAPPVVEKKAESPKG